jgi:2-polyprenyl-3-methyl-5-hydroxy-6-metoxy-1,4-benzoquinol methylase
MTTIQQVKQFWDSRPCNVKHSDKQIGTKEYFDEVEEKKLTAEPHIRGFSDFEQWRGRKVLEIGCGIGTAAINFARHGADYTGVELSTESLALAQKRFEVYDQPGTFYQGNAEQLDSFLPHAKYDLIYSWGVIHHTPDPAAVVAQLQQYAQSGTVVKIMVYASNSWKNYMIQAGLDQPEAQYGCPVVHTYTNEQAQALLGDAFEIIGIEQDHIFAYQIEPYKQGIYVLQPWFAHMPPDMFRSLEKRLGWHLMITARMK